MTLLQAIILGIIQGLTEFLPISSTAHLRIVPALLGWEDPGAAFTAVIQFGTLVAILLYFTRDIIRIVGAVVGGVVSGKPLHNQDARMGWMIAAGTVPIVVLGVLFKDSIETSLRSLYVISASLILLAIALWVAEIVTKRREVRGVELKTMDKLSLKEVLFVGFAQAVALIPGSSRSGTTITGGLLVGMNRETAASVRNDSRTPSPAIHRCRSFESDRCYGCFGDCRLCIYCFPSQLPEESHNLLIHNLSFCARNSSVDSIIHQSLSDSLIILSPPASRGD
jgi:undecaprenyl-diphosphatase UppP